MELMLLCEKARKQLADITGLKPICIAGVSRDENGWRVLLEMLEMSRIPSSTDLLGLYDVRCSEDGNVNSFERKSTRLRGETQKGG